MAIVTKEIERLSKIAVLTDKVRPCHGCSQPITFDKHIRHEDGRHKALNLDLSIHDCPRFFEEEMVVLSVIEYVRQINRRLTTSQLKLVREEKGGHD